MSNEDLDLTAYANGFQVLCRGRVVWQGNTWTGACRAMTRAREVYAQLRAEQANKEAA